MEKLEQETWEEFEERFFTRLAAAAIKMAEGPQQKKTPGDAMPPGATDSAELLADAG